MPDPIDAVLERIDTIRSNLLNFRRRNDISLLEESLDEVEEMHDDIEEIIEDSE